MSLPQDYTQRAVSEDEIMAKRSPRALVSGEGAWTKAQLAEWGVPWPPPAGWKAVLVANYARAEAEAING